jgi:capsular polysaccharide transport system permease protein
VVAKLAHESGLRDMSARPEADMFNRYPGPFTRDNLDALRSRFETMLTQTVDEGTGISRLEVVAFRPEDAQAVANALLKYAEDMVNRLNERAYRDALATSNKFVDSALSGLKDTETALTAYRDASGSVDPSGDAASTMKVIQTLTVQLSHNEASVLEQDAMAPKSQQTAALRERVSALRQEIERLKLKVVGAGPSASSKMGKFEELVLRRELAAKTLENAVLSRDKARENAEIQHLYVQVIRAPSLADVARYPRAFVDLAFLIATSAMIFLVLRGFMRAAREHRV